MFPAQSDLVVTPAVKPTPVFVAKEMNKYNISIDEILEVTKNYCLKILMPKNTYNKIMQNIFIKLNDILNWNR